jgi:hypothetical protein
MEMEFLEGCPVCQWILDEKRIVQKGIHCHKIKTDRGVVVVSSDHKSNVGHSGYVEACGFLLGDSTPSGIIREVLDWAGHWAAEICNLQDGVGRSTVGS